jgi:hypothetical protein
MFVSMKQIFEDCRHQLLKDKGINFLCQWVWLPSRVPAGLFLLDLAAGTCVVMGHMPTFPLNSWALPASHLGRPLAAKNMTFGMWDLWETVWCGPSSPWAKIYRSTMYAIVHLLEYTIVCFHWGKTPISVACSPQSTLVSQRWHGTSKSSPFW